MTHDCFPSPDPSVSNVQVIRLTLLCDEAPAPIVLDLTGIISLSPLFLSVPPSRSLLRGRVQPCPHLRHLAPLRCNSCAQKDCNGCVHAWERRCLLSGQYWRPLVSVCGALLSGGCKEIMSLPAGDKAERRGCVWPTVRCVRCLFYRMQGFSSVWGIPYIPPDYTCTHVHTYTDVITCCW